MPEDKFGEAQPIGKSSPELGSWTISGATNDHAPAPSDLSNGGSDVPSPPPPPTFQYGSAPPAPAMPTMPPPLVPLSSTDRNWYANLSMIFAIFGPGLIGIFLGAAGLKAAKQGRATNKTLAVRAIVANCVLAAFWGLVLLAVYSAEDDLGYESYDGSLDDTGFEEPADLPGDTELVGDVGVGMCFAEFERTYTLQTLQVLPCDEPHYAEVYYVGVLAEQAFVSDENIGALVDEICFSDQAISGVKPELVDDLYAEYFVPTQEGWSGGDRGYQCFAYLDPGPLNESVLVGDGLRTEG